jgi:hypothetical protein
MTHGVFRSFVILSNHVVIPRPPIGHSELAFRHSELAEESGWAVRLPLPYKVYPTKKAKREEHRKLLCGIPPLSIIFPYP